MGSRLQPRAQLRLLLEDRRRARPERAVVQVGDGRVEGPERRRSSSLDAAEDGTGRADAKRAASTKTPVRGEHWRRMTSPGGPMRKTLAALLLLASSSLAPSFIASAEMLVSTDWLLAHQKDPNLVLLHVGVPAEFEKEHIPGAIPVTPAGLRDPRTEGALVLQLLRARAAEGEARGLRHLRRLARRRLLREGLGLAHDARLLQPRRRGPRREDLHPRRRHARVEGGGRPGGRVRERPGLRHPAKAREDHRQAAPRARRGPRLRPGEPEDEGRRDRRFAKPEVLRRRRRRQDAARGPHPRREEPALRHARHRRQPHEEPRRDGEGRWRPRASSPATPS